MNIAERLASFENRRVLVVGDSIVDITTNVERIKDDDTGRPTYRTKQDERGKSDHYSMGGAALVVRNLLELGAKVDFITAFGYGTGALFASTWRHPHLKLHAVQVAKPQTVKHRFVCNGEKVMQVDTVDNSYDYRETENLWLTWDLCTGLYDKVHDAIVVADYRHGLISEATAQRIVKSHHHDTPLYVSSQVAQSGSNHHWYDAPRTRFVLNENEYGASRLLAGIAVVTDGEHGALVVHGTNDRVAAIDVSVVDTCGAGDAFLAAYCLTNDLAFANTWAGLSCTVAGANPPTQAMLLDWYAKTDPAEGKYEAMGLCG